MLLSVVRATSPGEFGTASGKSKVGRAGSENLYPAVAPSISGDQLVKLPAGGTRGDGESHLETGKINVTVVLGGWAGAGLRKTR